MNLWEILIETVVVAVAAVEVVLVLAVIAVVVVLVEVVVISEAVAETERCIQLLVLIVAGIAKFRSDLLVINQFFVAIVLNSKTVAAETIGVLIEDLHLITETIVQPTNHNQTTRKTLQLSTTN